MDVRPAAQCRQEPLQCLPAAGLRRNCPDLNSFGENRNLDRSAVISSTASPVHRSTSRAWITWVAG